jgi:hypothetical protein
MSAQSGLPACCGPPNLLGFVVLVTPAVAMETHGAISAVIANLGSTRPIDWQGHVIRSQSVALCITVGEEAPLQDFVGRG